jgi:molybdenum cofactor biosynthesis protein MoaC
MASKKTADLIPFCHTLPLESCKIRISEVSADNSLQIDCYVTAHYHTGVEMEALVGATHAALCIYDMTKALSKGIRIVDTRLLSKKGGKSDFNQEVAT